MAKSPKTGARNSDRKQSARSGGPSRGGTITSRTDEMGRRSGMGAVAAVAAASSGRQAEREGRDKTEFELIYEEAEDRFNHCETWEKESRRLFLEDLKFAEADPDNGFQWPNHMRRNRDVDKRPALTINKTRQHNLQIINDLKQNKPSIDIRPTGDGATFKSAQVYQHIVRDIERQSNASVGYDMASEFQVKAGIGYVRVATEYVDDKTFDQEIRIKQVNDPLSIYLDPDIKERSGRDARFGFSFEDVPIKRFEKENPQWKGKGTGDTLHSGDNWIDRDHVRVCEYWRRTEKKDRLIFLAKPPAGQGPSLDMPDDGGDVIQRESRLKELFGNDPDMLKQLLDDPGTRKRPIVTQDVEWFKIVGHEVVDKKPWPGKYIPIVRFIGEETIIDGKLDRKGHTRNLKDAQRIYNYWTSAAVEHIALQSKTPWTIPIQAVEGYETYWSTANKVNHSYLPYNAIDDDGNPLPKPERMKPPEFSDAYMKGMEVAGNELMYASGQYQAQMGQNENAKSGKAIGERQRQGDNATYHFVDNQGVAIRYVGEIIIDLIPKVYDTKRVKMIQARDGKNHQVTVDPQAQQAHEVEDDQRDAEAIKSIFNPNVGRYSVEADMGPSFATQRQEAFESFTKLLGAWKEGIAVVGDLYFRSADFPLADEAAERVKRMIPAHILGEGPTDAEKQLQTQVQQLTAMNTELTQKIAEEKLRTRTREEKRDIDGYKAITQRIDVLAKMILESEIMPKEAAGMWHDLVKQEHAATLNQIYQGPNDQPPTAEQQPPAVSNGSAGPAQSA
jgi:hypothetical protein